MLIEYTIRFLPDGVSVTQRVEPDPAADTAAMAASGGVVAQKSLAASFSSKGGAGNPITGPGGAGNPITGPGGAGNPITGSGGAGNPVTGPGGSANSTPVIVFGPIIIGAAAPAAQSAEVPPQTVKAAIAAAPAAVNTN